LYLIHKRLKSEGVFVVCCLGGGSTPLNILFQKLVAYKFALLYYRQATVPVAFFVKEGHSLFHASYNPNLLQNDGRNVRIVVPDTTDMTLIKNYLQKMSQGKKTVFTKEQLFEIIKSKY